MSTFQLHLLDTGYCLASEHHMMQAGERRTVPCHSLVALLHHPKHGWTLWDAGYAPRMLQAARGWPFGIYGMLTPLRIVPELAVVEQIHRFGLGAQDIRRIIISHFHADHVAGLRDFSGAEIIASVEAVEGIAGRNGMSALQRGYIPALLPDDFAHRVRLLPPFRGETLSVLGPTHDLFGDGSLQLVLLPGHARGQIGAFIQTERGPVLLAADGCWLSRAYRENRPPHPITRLFVDDWTATVETVNRLHAFAQTQPNVLIVPTHCPEIYATMVKEPQ